MVIYKTPALARGIGIGSIIFGILGLAFYWWVPFGIVLGLTGLILAFATWVMMPHQPRLLSLAIGGLLISAAALVVDLYVAIGGWEAIQFTSLR